LELTEIVEEYTVDVRQHPQEDKKNIEEPSDEVLMSSSTLSASIAALSSLKDALQPTLSQPTCSKTTVEDIAKTLLMPLLKDWVNQNLPSLVEKVVTEEVRRLTQRLS
jgi:cell pole-organizing protein PopZ